MKIITRKEARAKGLKKYFTGKPCSHGHIDYRKVCSAVCMECVRIAGRKWYEKRRKYKLQKSKDVYNRNKPKILARIKKYRENNKERSLKWIIDWRKNNPEKVYASQIKWRRKNPDRVYEWNRTQRARRKLSNGKHTNEDVAVRLKWQRGRCAACKADLGNRFEVDHYIPLARGGHNNPSNIQLLCSSCNRKKHAKDPVEFYQSMGFLL